MKTNDLTTVSKLILLAWYEANHTEYTDLLEKCLSKRRG
jgi:hypothetical protein